MNSIWPAQKKPEPIRLSRQKMPRHIAISIDPVDHDPNQTTLNSGLYPQVMRAIIETQVKLKINVLTFNAIRYGHNSDIDGFIALLEDLDSWGLPMDEQIKISVIGRWYDLPDFAIEKIKQIISKTKDNERLFVNIGVNYDGQEEIVDAVGRIARQIRANKIDPDKITKESIKTNLDTSALPPPDLIITTGKTFSLRSFLLWDAAYSKIFFSNVEWKDFKRGHLLKALVFYQNTK